MQLDRRVNAQPAMSTFQDRVRELKGFLGKLLPRAASLRSRRSLDVPETEVCGWPAWPSSLPIKMTLAFLDVQWPTCATHPHALRPGT